MKTINVQFSDNTESEIVSYFSDPQDSAVYANLGAVDTSDMRWKSFYNGLPDTIQTGLPAPE